MAGEYERVMGLNMITIYGIHYETKLKTNSYIVGGNLAYQLIILNNLFFLLKGKEAMILRRQKILRNPRQKAEALHLAPPLASQLRAPPPGGGGTSLPQGSCFRESPEDSARWEGAGPVRRAQSGRSLGWPGLSWAHSL